MLGQRWQARTFQLKNGVLSYSTTGSAGGPPSKTIHLWQCYAMKTKKLAGKSHCFAVYAALPDTPVSGNFGGSGYQKLRLAADDEKTVLEWISALYHAAGRPRGCVVKVSSMDGTLRCGCNFPSTAIDIDERGTIIALEADGKAAGLRVGDTIQTVNDDPVHSINAARAMVARVRRPFEMTVVRSNQAPVEPQQQPTKPALDLLSLEELPDAEDVPPPVQKPKEDPEVVSAVDAVRSAQAQVDAFEAVPKSRSFLSKNFFSFFFHFF